MPGDAPKRLVHHHRTATRQDQWRLFAMDAPARKNHPRTVLPKWQLHVTPINPHRWHGSARA
eukprot:11627614-Alexandrium_andersonii.AAC.1